MMDANVVSPAEPPQAGSMPVAPMGAASRIGKIRVRVAHGIPLIAMGVSATLSGSREFEVLGAATRANGAADVLITDVDALSVPGNGTAHRNVLIVAQDDGEAVIRKAMQKGVRGFLLHTCAADELIAAVRTVSRGGAAFAPWVASRIAQSFSFDPLSERELQVLRLLMQGSSDKDVARRLLIAPGTVKSHVRSILTKLGASRRTEAAAIAQRRGIARLDNSLDGAVCGDMRCLGL